MRIPGNIPTVTADMEGKVKRPNGAEWWIEINTPLVVKPTKLFLHHHADTWLMWECAADRNRSDEDQIQAGIRSLIEFAHTLVGQIDPLQKVGRKTESALGLGADPHRDHKTGKLPADIAKALQQRENAEQDAWKKISPVAERLGAGITRDGFTGWAHDIMNGNTSSGISQLL